MTPLRSEQLDQLAPALAAAQGKMKPAERNASNPHRGNRYADLTSVLEACRGPLAEHGLCLTQSIVTLEGGEVQLVTTLLHTSGQWVGASYPVWKPAKDGEAPQHQMMGSALTYGRRYSITALVGVVADDDDDGERAGAVGRPAAKGRTAPRDDGRREVNREFAARPEANGNGQGPTWAAYVSDRVDRAKKHWTTEMGIARVPADVQAHPDFAMPNAHEVTNHFVSHAVKSGAIAAEAIAKDGKPGVRDPAKAKAAMAELFAKAPKKIRAAVDGYFAEKERALRVKLGMDDADDGAEPAAVGGREAGSDDE